jgi:hypothetical protein
MSHHNAALNVHYPKVIVRHNVSNLINFPLVSLNTFVNLTAIGCSNHESMNESCTVSTEAVCPSRKTTLCSSPSTMKSTSDKLPSKALKTIKFSPTVSEIAGRQIQNNRNLIIKIPQTYKYYTPF